MQLHSVWDVTERSTTMSEERYQQGLEIRRKVLGDRYVDRATGHSDPLTDDFQNLLTEYCWGGVWGRDGLSMARRSLNNLCILATLGRDEEFELHVRGARRNGCTWDEIRETLIQVAVYSGMPAGVAAFRIAKRVRDEEQAGTTPS